MAKGNDYEWVFAKKLSLWLTGGADRSQLVRSIQSGGWSDRGVAHVGDLAPNGPAGERFRKTFGVEVKAYADQPDLWHLLSSGNPDLFRWWRKHWDDCTAVGILPLLIASRKYKPNIVLTPWASEPADSWRRYFTCPNPIDAPGFHLVHLDDFLSVDPEWYYERWS